MVFSAAWFWALRTLMIGSTLSASPGDFSLMIFSSMLSEWTIDWSTAMLSNEVWISAKRALIQSCRAASWPAG